MRVGFEPRLDGVGVELISGGGVTEVGGGGEGGGEGVVVGSKVVG